MIYDPASGELLTTWGYLSALYTVITQADVYRSGVWTPLPESAVSPAVSEAYFPPTRTIIGIDQAGRTWSFANDAWIQLHPAQAAPAGRDGASLAFDGSHLVLFGGWDGSYMDPPADDTWLWNGTDWLAAAATVAPPPRWNASMATDPTTGDVVLFGGDSRTDVSVPVYGDAGDEMLLGDTWTWDGAAWSPAVAAGPAPRGGAAMSAYPPAGGVVLTGGHALSTTAGDGLGAPTLVELADTWEFASGRWTLLVATGSPAGDLARADYAPGLGAVLLDYAGQPQGHRVATWILA
ncbi:MAG: hypothetical protein ACYDAY_00155 [Candidatus Dormibacteria bacterium]